MEDFLRANPGILFIFSAGNSGNGVLTPTCPTCYDYPHVISVSAIDQSGALTAWTNLGALLAAPGENIITSVPMKGKGAYSLESGYIFSHGTSLSAPVVAAACAGRLLLHPGENPAEVREALVQSADKEDRYWGRIKNYGRVTSIGYLQFPSPRFLA